VDSLIAAVAEHSDHIKGWIKNIPGFPKRLRRMVTASILFVAGMAAIVNGLGVFIAEIFNYAKNKSFIVRRTFLIGGFLLLGGLIFGEMFQLRKYYRTAPLSLEDCRRNSYGSWQAAQYLSDVSDIENYQIVADNRMTVSTHLKYSGINCIGANEPTNRSSKCSPASSAPASMNRS